MAKKNKEREKGGKAIHFNLIQTRVSSQLNFKGTKAYCNTINVELIYCDSTLKRHLNSTVGAYV